MSLQVSDQESARAEEDKLTDLEFIEVVERSLPAFHSRVEEVVGLLRNGENFVIVDHRCTDDQRAQILRGMSSTSIRTTYERVFRIDLAFRNCEAIGGKPAGEPSPKFDEFVSIRSQILAQSPELLHC